MLCTRTGWFFPGIRGFSFVREVLGRRVSGYFPVRPPRHPLARLTPLRGRGIRGSSFFEVDFDNSALGSFRECSFIPSRVDNGDFGRGRPYNLIRIYIKHRDIPLPWRGVGVLCTRTGWLFPAHGRGGSFCS